MKLFGGKKDLIGLDIGSNSVKIVQISHTRKGLQLKNLGITGLAHGCISDGSIQDPDTTLEGVRNLLDHLKIRVKYVATSLSGHAVIIKKASLPSMPQEELEKNVIFEAEPYIPFDIEDVNIDFHIIGPDERDPDKMEVLLIAAKRDAVDQYANIVEATGLTPIIMDVECLALANAYETNYPPEEEGSLVLVDIGAEKMTINVIKEEIPIFVKEVPLGGYQITQQIQSAYSMEYQEAENLKIGGTTDQAQLKKLEEILVSITPTWADEIKQVVDLISTTRPKDVVKKIVLSGGSSRIRGLDKLINMKTNVPVEILNPFSNIHYDEKVFDREYVEYMGPQVAICVGLALRSMDEK
ncbi:MAG TPA: type IV pilus assembly protein PilM [Syntrophaceae bacterium]|nr:type IV pilus assembly protein PilM [Syntrophaceae bacterium]